MKKVVYYNFKLSMVLSNKENTLIKFQKVIINYLYRLTSTR